MTTKASGLKRLKSAAAKAAAGAAAAKVRVRLSKAQLKQARKVFKAAKKAAKQARRKLDAAGSARPPRPAATLKLKPAIRRSPRATKPVHAPKAAPPKRVESRRPLKKPLAPRASKARAPKEPPMRSAAEIAKSVIERLHAPPPILAPAPVIPPETNPIPGDSAPGTPHNS
jgi:hypothetical protein